MTANNGPSPASTRAARAAARAAARCSARAARARSRRRRGVSMGVYSYRSPIANLRADPPGGAPRYMP